MPERLDEAGDRVSSGAGRPRSITVRARDVRGRVRGSFVLGHGEDPVVALGGRGWSLVRPLSAATVSPTSDDVVIDLEVDDAAEPRAGEARAADVAAPGRPSAWAPAPASASVPTDVGLIVAPGEEVHIHQRLAAYAVITRDGSILLTELSAEVRGGAGRWTLPGGGVDRGEAPGQALVREVWEETGHELIRAHLVEVTTSHWVGRAPTGRLEDFHAVRLVHRAEVTDVREPVVHDVDGSTARAAWVPVERLTDMPLTPFVTDGASRWLDP